MEPEEIDKLFKDRLAGLPAMPSADAWQRLQQKMDSPKKERSLWIYYAAASIVILLLSGILLMRTNTQDPGLASNTHRETKLPVAQNKKPYVFKGNIAETRIAEQTTTTDEAPENKSPNKVNKAEQIAQNSSAASITKETKGKFQNKLPKASNNKATYLAATKEIKKNNDSSSDYKVADNNDANSTNSKPFSLANNTNPALESALTASIVEVSVKKIYTDESAGDENGLRESLAKKTLLLKNIYKQARNLKNGEPVELTALGVDKEKLQAETKEIKQKINKVISL